MRIMICSDLHWDDDFEVGTESDIRASSGSAAATGRGQPLQRNKVFRLLIGSSAFNTLTADDLICIAGDVAEGIDGIRQCLTEMRTYTDATIVGVMGNHDYTDQALAPITVDRIQAELPERVHLLDNQLIELKGIRVLGCTLWTNPNPDFHEVGQELMPEYGQVNNQNGLLLSVADTLAAHHESVAWLNTELAKPFKGKTVVMTHHAPSFISQHDRHQFSELKEFFCVELDDLIYKHQPQLWIHGHLHDPVDYELDETRIVSSPLGYPDERRKGFHPVVLDL
jgi:predicted phosphohydrolase